jgi:hypothetical protein
MRLLVTTAAVSAGRSLAAVAALWISTLRLFVATRLAAMAALTVAAVLRCRTTVGARLLLTSETTWLLTAMCLLSVVAAGRVVRPGLRTEALRWSTMLRAKALRRGGTVLRAIALRRRARMRGARVRAVALGWRAGWLVGIRRRRTRVSTTGTAA